MLYSVTRIADNAGLEGLSPEWEEIDGLSSPRTPFTSFSWNRLWWRHFSESRLWIRDELYVLAVRDDHDRLIAVAPLMRSLRPAWGPLRLREIRFFGADRNVTELRGLVCRPEHRAGAERALQAHLLEHAEEWDNLLWCGARASDHVEALGARVPRRVVTDYHLCLPRSWLELRSGLSRNMKESLRKSYNSLKRDGHDFAFRVVSDPVETDSALNEFFKLHRARAELAGTVPHPDSFKTAPSRKFLRDYVQDMARRDRLRIFQLTIGGTVVAARIGFVIGDELYLYYSGYRPEWRRYGVMTTLIAESIKWAMDRQFKIVNLSTGSDYAKLRWRPVETVVNEYLVFSPGIRKQSVQGRLASLLGSAPVRALLGRAVAAARRGT